MAAREVREECSHGLVHKSLGRTILANSRSINHALWDMWAPGRDPEGSNVMDPLDDGVNVPLLPRGFGSGLLPLVGISMAGLAARCSSANSRNALRLV